MPRLPVPSIPLLRTFLQPSSVTCLAHQSRSKGSVAYSPPNFTPRHKYAKVNRLDKLHRQQKAGLRQEKEESQTRAVLLGQDMKLSIEGAPATVAAADLSFHIGRTKTKNLAVYESTKNGGTKHITQLRRLSGDLHELQRQLRSILQLPDSTVDGKGRRKEPVAINTLTQQIIIKGWRAPEVKKWAETLGF